MFEYALFDLDGTLTDPALGITNSIMYALDKMGREIPPRESLYSFIGPPLVQSFQSLGMTKDEAETALRTYREYFSVKGLFENKVYDGIPEALETLSNAGVKIILATSKPELYAAQILEHFSLDKYFTSVCGASMDEKRVDKADVIKYALDTNGHLRQVKGDNDRRQASRHHRSCEKRTPLYRSAVGLRFTRRTDRSRCGQHRRQHSRDGKNYLRK